MQFALGKLTGAVCAVDASVAQLVACCGEFIVPGSGVLSDWGGVCTAHASVAKLAGAFRDWALDTTAST